MSIVYEFWKKTAIGDEWKNPDEIRGRIVELENLRKWWHGDTDEEVLRNYLASLEPNGYEFYSLKQYDPLGVLPEFREKEAEEKPLETLEKSSDPLTDKIIEEKEDEYKQKEQDRWERLLNRNESPEEYHRRIL